MLASLESAVPILASAIFTNLYNATSELTYPWQGSFYFGCIGFSSIGMALKMDIGHWTCIVKTETIFVTGVLITIFVYISLGCKQIEPSNEEKSRITEKSHL